MIGQNYFWKHPLSKTLIFKQLRTSNCRLSPVHCRLNQFEIVCLTIKPFSARFSHSILPSNFWVSNIFSTFETSPIPLAYFSKTNLFSVNILGSIWDWTVKTSSYNLFPIFSLFPNDRTVKVHCFENNSRMSSLATIFTVSLKILPFQTVFSLK